MSFFNLFTGQTNRGSSQWVQMMQPIATATLMGMGRRCQAGKSLAENLQINYTNMQQQNCFIVGYVGLVNECVHYCNSYQNVNTDEDDSKCINRGNSKNIDTTNLLTVNCHTIANQLINNYNTNKDTFTDHNPMLGMLLNELSEEYPNEDARKKQLSLIIRRSIRFYDHHIKSNQRFRAAINVYRELPLDLRRKMDINGSIIDHSAGIRLTPVVHGMPGGGDQTQQKSSLQLAFAGLHDITDRHGGKGWKATPKPLRFIANQYGFVTKNHLGMPLSCSNQRISTACDLVKTIRAQVEKMHDVFPYIGGHSLGAPPAVIAALTSGDNAMPCFIGDPEGLGVRLRNYLIGSGKRFSSYEVYQKYMLSTNCPIVAYNTEYEWLSSAGYFTGGDASQFNIMHVTNATEPYPKMHTIPIDYIKQLHRQSNHKNLQHRGTGGIRRHNWSIEALSTPELAQIYQD